MGDTAEQLEAIEANDREILVEAGAGSGKTRTTIKRYQRLIGELDDPSKILVFTFTDKAATELREKVRELRASTDLDFSMSSAWVGTFHSICARILRSHPIAARIDPAFAILDDIRAERLKERAYEKALAEVLENPAHMSQVVKYQPLTLKEGIQAAFENLRARGEASPELPPIPVPRVQNTAASICENLRAAIRRSESDDFSSATWKNVSALGSRLGLPDQTTDLDFEEFYAATTWLRKTGAAGTEELCSLAKELCSRFAEIEFGEEIHAALDALLTGYGTRYSQLKFREGVLDYEDLQLKTLNLLESHPEIKADYNEQFAEIMVDEFQDTNQLQLKLIRSLQGDSTSLFTVGDEMQSIYGFRYADVELFRARRRIDGIKRIQLQANFRSQPEVIAAVNRIGKKLDEQVDYLRGAVGTSHEFATLTVGKEERLPGSTKLLLTEKEVWSEQSLEPLIDAPGEGAHVTASRGQSEAEALKLAQEIRRVVETGEFEPRDIVILFRTKANIWKYEEALRHVGLEPYVVGGTGFWDSREGADLRALIAVLANPLDDDSLIGALAGPGCGISSTGLLSIAQHRTRDDFFWTALKSSITGDEGVLGASDHARASRFVALVEDLRRRVPELGLGRLVEEMVTGTGYDLVCLTRDPGGSGLANIRQVASIAADFETTEGRDLRGLIEWIDASRRLDTEASVATEDESSNVVRMMTIHKSKGLQFGMVCVADLGRSRRSQFENVVWIGPPDAEGDAPLGIRIPHPSGDNLNLFAWQRLFEDASPAASDEELRLFHVAMTRAERRLVLSGVASLEKPPNLGEYSSNADRIVLAFDLARDEPPPVALPCPPALDELGYAVGSCEMKVEWNRPEGLEALLHPGDPVIPAAEKTSGIPVLGRPDNPARPAVPLSYSALAEFSTCPTRFYARRILKLDGPDTEDGKSSKPVSLDPEMMALDDVDAGDFGSAVHLMLERLPGRRWRALADDEMKKILSGRKITGVEAFERAKSMVEGFTASPLGRRVADLKTEVESRLLVEIGGVMVRGFADLLARNSDPPLVLDYKTNRLDGGIETLMSKYVLQRDLYALAVGRTLKTDSVETAFVFLESPEQPEITLFEAKDLGRVEKEIGALVADVTLGRYLGEPEATHKPCGICWACGLMESRLVSTQKGMSESATGGDSSD